MQRGDRLCSPGEAFDWTLASVAGTAIGTTLLAGATGALAFLTREQAEIAAQALQLQTKPHILPVHEVEPNFEWPGTGGNAITLSLQIQNAGNGVAEITRVEVRCGDLGPRLVLRGCACAHRRRSCDYLRRL